MKHTLSILVNNHPGVMSHVSGLFTRRGYNIDSIAVGVTDDPEISSMTIVLNGDDFVVGQVKNQL
nr:acetolactate synthase small subunit [Leptospira sp.]